MAELGAPISQDGVAVQPDCGCVFICTTKSRRWRGKDTIFGYQPMGALTCLNKQEVQKRSQNAAQHYAKVHGYVNDDLRANGLWKRWGFRVGTWNADSLTGRAGEIVEALLDTKVDVACIRETQWKGSGCKFCGTKGKRNKLLWVRGEER